MASHAEDQSDADGPHLETYVGIRDSVFTDNDGGWTGNIANIKAGSMYTENLTIADNHTGAFS